MSAVTEEKIENVKLKLQTPKKTNFRTIEIAKFDHEKVFQQILKKCKVYLQDAKNDEIKSEVFASLIGEHVSIDIIPKPLTNVGIRLAESGVFLLAYSEFQAQRNQIEKQALLKTYEAMVKTQLEYFYKQDDEKNNEQESQKTQQQNNENKQSRFIMKSIQNRVIKRKIFQNDQFQTVVEHKPKQKRFNRTEPQKQYRATCYRKHWTVSDQIQLIKAYLRHFDKTTIHYYVSRQVSRSARSTSGQLCLLRVQYPKSQNQSYYDQAMRILEELEKIYKQQKKQKERQSQAQINN